LLERSESGIKPEEVVPSEIIFAEEEQARLHRDILAVKVPPAILRRLDFFVSQFEFCDYAATQFEYKTKDTVKLAGSDWAHLTSLETGKDALKDVGAQTRNGVSVRTLMEANGNRLI